MMWLLLYKLLSKSNNHHFVELDLPAFALKCSSLQQWIFPPRNWEPPLSAQQLQTTFAYGKFLNNSFISQILGRSLYMKTILNVLLAKFSTEKSIRNCYLELINGGAKEQRRKGRGELHPLALS